jgi:hypothetical protein
MKTKGVTRHARTAGRNVDVVITTRLGEEPHGVVMKVIALNGDVAVGSTHINLTEEQAGVLAGDLMSAAYAVRNVDSPHREFRVAAQKWASELDGKAAS